MPSIDDIINRQFCQWEMQEQKREEAPPVRRQPVEIVTVSGEHGSRGTYFASLLANRLKYQLFYKEIVETICALPGIGKGLYHRLTKNIDHVWS
jgi:hypothetical protein